MISIGTHRLYTSISGPPRQPRDPLIIVIAGAGDVASSYTALVPLVSQRSQVLLYDRSGLGHSEPSPGRSTAVSHARELHSLLDAMGLKPPLLLVAHSFGAILAREFLHFYADEVAGMVLAEGATERQCDYFIIPDENIMAVLGDLNWARVTGLREDSRLSRDEWRARAIDIARGAAAAQAEADSYVEVCRTLAQKNQFQCQAMGDRPLSVIRCNSARDYARIYEQGVKAGNGTARQRQAFRELLDQWDTLDQELKEEQLKLSSNAKLVHLPDCGHNVHLIRPDVVMEGIEWVLDQLQSPDVEDTKL
ncbi:alpha/beta hydrolase fold protein [Penicillium maclennaniae]|uniref:alpha/beta hydrolase fold protein n=1 Tax=Penicillium maclennaniae TaxID=1343394 RepID=UPI002540BC12|nr:alpha/beta hydrolase fold protein [Penicillium maclennaniae]KAJ5676949.1 alpha/beta hydrolase fold protein [Penicillium maclennaniae]